MRATDPLQPRAPKPHLSKCRNPMYPLLWKCHSRNVGQYENSPVEAYRKWEALGGRERG